MRSFLRHVWVIMRYELADSVKSRRVVILLVLYLAGAMLACNGFITVMHRIEDQLSETLALPSASSAGVVTNALWRSKAFRRMVVELVGNRETALEILSIPPIAVVYGWLALTFTPVLVTLSASGRIAEEVSSGSVRYVLTRTPRPAWCLGKFMGQACEVLLALMLSAIGTWCVARFRMATSGDIQTARWIILHAWKAWIYSLAFVGLALGISQIMRSPYYAMGLSLIVVVGMGIISLMATHWAGDGWRQLWQLVDFVVPMGHKMGLWRLKAAYVCTSSVYLVALGFAYCFAGYSVFARRGA